MSVSLALACLWAVAANLLALRPFRDGDVRALALVALGVPVLGLVTWQHGPWPGLIGLLVGMAVLRWPVVQLLRWPGRETGGA
jgi:hypothetical protein